MDEFLDNSHLSQPWHIPTSSGRSDNGNADGLKAEVEGSHNGSRRKAVRVVHKLLPQQSNGHDCGVFLLEYAEQFLKGAIKASNQAWLAGVGSNQGQWFDPASALKGFHDKADYTKLFDASCIGSTPISTST